MNDIFEESLIYPLRVKYKTFFRDYFDSVFVAFMPFFKVDEVERSWLWRMTASEEELKFPNDKEIYERGSAVLWDMVIKGAGLKDSKELCKALETRYGGYSPVFRRDDLADKLRHFEEQQDISRPDEDSFGILSKISIYKSLKLLCKNELLYADEYHNIVTRPIKLKDYTEYEFSEKIGNGKVIYPADKEILFTIYWDQPFFLIATSKINLDRILAQNYFEGFICDEETDGDWAFGKEELKDLLKLKEAEIQKYRDQKNNSKTE